MEKRLFSELGLSAEILKAVDKMGFEEASPIQTAVIPEALTGRDVIGQSATGSGKTAAYGIPAIERIDGHKRSVQVLILCPTRELAVQVSEEMSKLALFKRGIQSVPIYGGQSYERQFRALAAGVQIVIGTPGRLMDHMERGTLKLDNLKMVVLDEADRMLDMGFRDDIDHILRAVPEERQLLFFSATMPSIIRGMIERFANNPAWVRIEAHAANAPKVEQVYYEVDRRSKIDVLTRVIDLHDFRYGIIFCSTKIMVDELHDHLHARGYATDRLHGDITQMQRNKVMEKFKRRGFEFLVATDVAARGLDIDDLEVVFNFDLPNDGEDYTHRIGRTGRAGRSGKAFTLVSGRELYKLQSMVRYAKLKIRRESVPSIDQVEEARVNVFFEKLRTTLDAKKFAKQDRMVDRLLEQGYASTDICSALIHMMQGGAEADDKPAHVSPKANMNPGSAPYAGKSDYSPAAAPAPTPTPSPERAEMISDIKKEYGQKPVREREDKPFYEAFTKPHAKAAKPPREGLDEDDINRPARTGREPGYKTIFINVGRKNLVTPADIVGKIAGVTRMPANIIGAIDLHQRHSLVDVGDEHVDLVIEKLTGVRIKGESLTPKLAEKK